ncbi:hypothetical protein B0H10DRAFT_1379670 [Mycena sp. CBHHK59/15]|nr:hypothetical protein B0H10DRAFT_1379670 [Mycena sp. CBHHK59/15]
MGSDSIGNKSVSADTTDAFGFCPIRQLPNEITSEIFIHCVDDDPDISSPELPPTPAIALSQVCRGWRAIALALPRLWNALNLNNPSSDLISICIARSGQHPLSLRLRTCNKDAFDVASQFQARWQAVSIGSTWDKYLEMACGDYAEQLPLLRTLVLELTTPPEAPQDRSNLLSFFGAAPLLQDLCLRNLSPFVIKAPFLQLTTFRTYELCPWELLKVVEKSTALVTCVFLNTKSNPRAYLNSHVTHEALKSLHLHDTHYLSLLHDFLKRSECPLEHLHISDYFNETELLDCLEATPIVTALTLSTTLITPSSLILAWLVDFPTFLPNLTSLEFRVAGHEWSRKTLVDMLWSRWHPDNSAGYGILQTDDDGEHAQLRTFKLSCRMAMDDANWRRVQTLRKEGMTIEIDREGGS